MSWHDLELNIPSLEADIVNQVYDNIVYIKDAFESHGISVEQLEFVGASHSLRIHQVAPMLQRVENNLDRLDAASESINYDGHKEIFEIFTLQDYQRWVLILNDLYDIVNGKGQWGGLVLLPEPNSPDAQDVYGNDIYIRGETIG